MGVSGTEGGYGAEGQYIPGGERRAGGGGGCGKYMERYVCPSIMITCRIHAYDIDKYSHGLRSDIDSVTIDANNNYCSASTESFILW